MDEVIMQATSESTDNESLPEHSVTRAELESERSEDDSTAGFPLGTPKTTGVTFGTPAAGTTFGTPAAAPFGTPAAGAVGVTGGYSFGTGTTTTTTAAPGFSLGGGPATSAGFGLATTVAKTTAVVGTPFGVATSTAVTPGLPFGGVAKTTAGLSLGAAASTGYTLGGTTTAGLTLGQTKPATSTGLALGGFASGGVTGLGGTSTTKTGLTLGSTVTSSSGFAFGGGSTSTGTSGLGGTSLITGAVTTTASRGLGGVDPKNSTCGTGSVGTKPGENKAVKEAQVPQEICTTVEEFKKYVKNRKTVRESISRMSSKPMYKVQEEVATVKQLLSLVYNGLQRNAVAIEKLKSEARQELKHAEISQRTEDTPPGLQWENSAPTEYFQRLAEDFEVRMVTYRQQIEEMERHLASLHQPAMLTPQELSMLLNKLHESFVALAAQLQTVHQAVKAQKEHYLNYIKIIHDENSNVFEKRKIVEEKTGSRVLATTVGPTPFTGMCNAAAVAMASAISRTQQPSAPSADLLLNPAGTFGASNPLGQPTGLGTGTGLFGTGTTVLGSGFGSSGFGQTAATSKPGFPFGTQTATVRPLGSLSAGATSGGLNSGLFGDPTGFASPGNTSLGFGTTTGQTFQLQKPPAGNKRGKKS